MTVYTAIIDNVDVKYDLAILHVTTWPLHHDYTQLSTRNIHDGNQVDVVGSTAGLPFSYSHGYVGATRQGDDFKSFKVLQVSAPIYFGNSGGGVFDMDGNLVGIADFVIFHAGFPVPCLGFAIHRDVIMSFLATVK
jgi:serine protease Do